MTIGSGRGVVVSVDADMPNFPIRRKFLRYRFRFVFLLHQAEVEEEKKFIFVHPITVARSALRRCPVSTFRAWDATKMTFSSNSSPPATLG